MAKIANDGRKRGFKSGVPSCDAIRSFRARHPELRYRKSESKENVKLKVESFGHVSTYVDGLKEVESDYPGIFDHGDLLWNMDETHVDGEFRKRKKVYSPADTHHGGFIASRKTGGDGRHVTVVIAVSASGRKAPPFFIVEGKRNMSNWYLKLDENEYKLHNGHLNVLTQGVWFPNDACVVMAENGSMEQRIIPLFIDHLNRFVGKFVPHDKHYTLVLDGHSSIKGIEWLELALEKNCVVVQSPANTSHFLQPCDQQVNKTFGTTVRSVRDALVLASNRKMDHGNIQIKLMLGAMAFEAISPEDVRVSWSAGLWPMDFKFAERWRTRTDAMKDENSQLVCALERSGHGIGLAAVQKRKTDNETFNILATIVEDVRNSGSSGVSSALRAVARCLEKHETVHSILESRTRVDSRTTASRVSAHIQAQNEKSKNIVLPAGAPAEYLTHGDVMRKRREELAAKDAEEAAKTEKRKRQAEQKLLGEEQKQERARIRAEAKEKRKRDAELKAGMQQKRKRRKTMQAATGSANDVVDALMSLGGDGNAAGVHQGSQQ